MAEEKVGKGCECIYQMEKHFIDLAIDEYLLKLEGELAELKKRIKAAVKEEPEKESSYKDLLESNRNLTATLSNDLRKVKSRFEAMPSC